MFDVFNSVVCLMCLILLYVMCLIFLVSDAFHFIVCLICLILLFDVFNFVGV